MDEKRYIVASLVATSGDKHEGCMIVEEDGIILGTHAKVFGPDTRRACEQWVAANCKR
jgi:hypothetical protein